MRADRGDVDRLVRQRLGDLGEQAAGDQRGAVGVGLHLDAHLAGDLVVEAGDVQPAVGHPQHDAGEHRHRRAAGQALGRPCHGVGECVSLHPELHAVLRVALTGVNRVVLSVLAVEASGADLNSMARGEPERSPDPGAASEPGAGPRAGSSTPSPTLMIAFCFLRRDNSSSSGLCIVWRTGVCAGQRVIHRCSHVGNQGTNPGLRPQSPTRAAVVHRCPPAIHRLSTGFVPRPGDSAGTPPTRRPQNLQQEIHTPPQAVDRDVTLGTCPHRFPQELSTSVRKTRASCPPLGTNPWGRTVDNVGTPVGENRTRRGLAGTPYTEPSEYAALAGSDSLRGRKQGAALRRAQAARHGGTRCRTERS